MDPERMAELLRAAQAASRRGAPLDRVNEEIHKRTNGEFGDVRSLAAAARQSGVSRDQLAAPPLTPGPVGVEREASFGEKAGGMLGLFTQGVTFGFGDELAGVLQGVNEAVKPGGEGFSEGRRQGTAEARQRLEQARDDLGILGTGAEIGGAAAAPVGAAGRFVARGPTFLSRLLRGGLVGAGEGAAFGAGNAEGSLAERLPAAGRGAAIGLPAGAAGPAAVDAARAVGRGVKALGRTGKKATQTARRSAKAFNNIEEVEELERTIGPRLADDLREEGGILGKPSRVRSEIDEARTGIFGELDEIDEIQDEALQRVLQKDDVASFVPDEVAQGSRPPSFPEAQGAARQIAKQKGKALEFGDAASFRKLTKAEREIRRALDDALDGRFSQANEAFAEQAARGRALEAGEKAFSNSADEVQETFNALSSEAERTAFREGLASRFLSRLEDNTALPTTLKKIQNAPETRNKLRILFDGDSEAFEAFVDAARRAENVQERAKAGRLVERQLMRNFLGSLSKAAAAGLGIGGGAALAGGLLGE